MVQLETELEVLTEVNRGGAYDGLLRSVCPMLGGYFLRNGLHSSVIF